MKKFVLLLLLGVFTLSACGPATPEPTPTMSVVDIQSTAVSMVWTMVAQTQAAIPTNTPLPTETPTPPPTNTPLPSPTVDSLLNPGLLPTNTPIPTTASSSGGDPCNRILNTWIGASTRLLINNQTGGDVTLSMYIKSNRGGECGYKSFVIGGSSAVTELPELSCFSVYGWVKTKKKEYTISGGAYCTNTTDKYTLELQPDGKIKFIGP